MKKRKMDLNWNSFNTKHNNWESTAFQNMCYELFCIKFKQEYGIPSYANHKALECKPIQFEGNEIGFQAKYFTKADNANAKKGALKEAILRVNKEYSKVNELYFYVHPFFGQSTQKGKDKSNPQIDVEKYATDLGLTIVWQVESELSIQLESNKRVKSKYFPPISFQTSSEQLDIARTALIQIEVKKLEYRFDHGNWKEAEQIVRELSTYRDFNNDNVSETIIDFLSKVSNLCRHGMTSSVIYEVISITELFLPNKAGDEKSLSFFILMRSINIGYNIAYDAVIHLNSLNKIRYALQFWKDILRTARFYNDTRIIQEIGRNLEDLYYTVKNRNREDFKGALWLINIYREDFKNPKHGTPLLPDDLYRTIEKERDREDLQGYKKQLKL